jgi:OOP family OmpA-OmpF porin
MNKILSKPNSLLAISAIALSLASLNVTAQDRMNDGRGYWTEPATNNQVWRNGFGECWRSLNPTDGPVTAGCDPIVPPRAAAAPAPIAQAPTPVAPTPAPRPAPVNLKISLSADALFDFDKSVIKPEGKAHLDTLVDQLKTVNLEKLIAVGHTDSKGSDAYNDKLALRRVHAVEAYLVSKGIADNRIAASGMGEKQPVAPNTINGKDNPEGRAKNRRVEIEVVGTQAGR